MALLKTSTVTDGLKRMAPFFADVLEDGSVSDFTCPTSEDWRDKKGQLSLAKLTTLWSNNVKPHYCLTVIEVLLSDNQARKHSAVAGGNNCHNHNQALAKDQRIAKVGVVIRPDWENCITALYFYGRDNNAIFTWIAGNQSPKGGAGTKYEEQEIGKGEELIGFHGIKGKKQFISAIGLIVRRVLQ